MSTSVESIKENILRIVQERGPVTFADINNHVEGFKSNEETTSWIRNPHGKNMYAWIGMTENGAEAIKQLIKEYVVILNSCPMVNYLCDGTIPAIPVASEDKDYAEPHWSPMEIAIYTPNN